MSFSPSKFWSCIAHRQPEQHLYVYQTVGSTNTVLLEHLKNGAPKGSIVVAAQQTAGRGQWGRTWVSPIGGLYMSVAIAPDLAVSQTSRLTLASAWGIASRLRHCQLPIKLKWPNDLYLQAKKLGGILTETSVRQAHIYQAVVGVGINWRNTPPDTGIRLVHPAIELPQSIDSLESLAALVVNGISAGQRSLINYGLTEIGRDYRQWLYQPLPEQMTWDSL